MFSPAGMNLQQFVGIDRSRTASTASCGLTENVQNTRRYACKVVFERESEKCDFADRC